jgi:hypothetical protein
LILKQVAPGSRNLVTKGHALCHCLVDLDQRSWNCVHQNTSSDRSLIGQIDAWRGQMERRMPLARYLFHVGSVLLALLFIADACLPKLPVAHGADGVSYGIRIHSDRKWPERVVYDTSLPIITPPQGVDTEQSTASPATIASARPREHEAFAQLRPSDANQLQSPDSKKREPKLQHQRKIAKRHMPPTVLLVARQSRFGWYGYW